MIPYKQISLILLSIFLISSCRVFYPAQKITSKKVKKDGREMLYGQITPEQLYFDYPEWKEIEESYQPQAEFIDKLKSVKNKTKVIVFLGTWCHDSKREVPHFFKIIHDAGLENQLKIELWAVDREKNLDNDLPQKYQIEYVPTFIFERDGKELGRIIESPGSYFLEEDIWDILSGSGE